MPSLRVAVVCSLVLAGVSFVAAPEQADARPQYLREFAKKYENLKAEALKTKCFVCHPKGDDKKVNNDYGTALKKQFGEEKNVKDNDKIAKAYTTIEKEKSSVEGKTFGDLIKEGKLPGTNPEEPKPEA
ncbi:MAG TPA: hypothetical protein VF170_16850 [Planctomycetaceae bacterium]